MNEHALNYLAEGDRLDSCEKALNYLISHYKSLLEERKNKIIGINPEVVNNLFSKAVMELGINGIDKVDLDIYCKNINSYGIIGYLERELGIFRKADSQPRRFCVSG